MALISKELKQRGAYAGILLTLGSFLLNGKIVTKDHLINLSKFGVVPVLVANAIMHILAQLLPKLRALQEEGEYGQKELKKYTKELALLITAAEAYLTQSNLIEVPFQLGATYALSEISELNNQKGLGNSTANLFIVQLLKDIAKESRLLFATSSITQIISMAALTLPIIATALLYNHCEYNIKIVGDSKIQHTTHHITKHISVSFTSKRKHINTLPIRVAAAGTMPLMHAFSLFMMIGLDCSWAIVFGAFLVCAYLLETTQVINTHEITKKLKSLNLYICNIRPGADTKAYLDQILKRAIIIGLPLILVLGLYPFIVFNSIKAIGLAISVPLFISESHYLIKQVKSYNMQYNLEGSF